MVLLKLHKYFFWADKKLHSVLFIENKDDITEDLLHEFRDEDSKKRFVQTESLASKKQAAKEAEKRGPARIDTEGAKNKITKEDLLFGSSKKKFVKIDDEDDFPDLDGESDDDLPKPTKQVNRGHQRAAGGYAQIKQKHN